MTDLALNMGTLMAQSSSFVVTETYWGYKISSGRGPSIAIALGQAVSFFFGVCLLTAAIGILVLPALFFDGELGVMRIGSAVLFGATAIYLLWFASRGTQAEVHVDNSFAEVREVICNRAGRPTTVGSYSFDAISGVFLEEGAEDEPARIIMRYHSTAHDVIVAEGHAAQLLPLRDRLARDILGTLDNRAA